jgi:hypothetical protein
MLSVVMSPMLNISHSFVFSIVRYSFQEMIPLRQQDFPLLSKMRWCLPAAFAAKVKSLSIGNSFQALVPSLGDDNYLRIKVVKEAQRRTLACAMNIEPVTSPCGRFRYYFGYEPQDLRHADSFGYVVSIWEKHPKVLANELTYDFATGLLRCWGSGSARRVATKCGLQTFFKMTGRSSNRPHPSAAVDQDEVGLQQYWNQKFGNDPMSALLRKQINILTNDVLEIAREQNPYLMRLVGHNCSMGLVTTGSVPKFNPAPRYLTTTDALFAAEEEARKKRWAALAVHKKQKLSEASDSEDSDCPSSLEEDIAGHFGDVFELDTDSDISNPADSQTPPSDISNPADSQTPPIFSSLFVRPMRQTNFSASSIGVIISSHVDKPDYLSKAQKDEWCTKSSDKGWDYCLSLLDHDLFCLPTTCAYQFCYRDATAQQQLHPRAFFSMEGLGLAMELQHGISHHFMGGAFAHHTSIPYCRRRYDGLINCSNSDDNLLIVGWGGFGGRKDVTERQARREAPTLAIVLPQLERERAARLAAEARIRLLELQADTLRAEATTQRELLQHNPILPEPARVDNPPPAGPAIFFRHMERIAAEQGLPPPNPW